MKDGVKYTVSLSFEEIKLPPFQDILILGRDGAQGRIGLSRSFELLIPNGFETIPIDEDNVEAIFVNKKILRKLPVDRLIAILKEKVFPFVSKEELIRVDCRINIALNNIELEHRT
ncbi:hypothetical protein VRU48_02945 [Pedobacter sp. KR3-3]|uniref:Uncharacterized protein n=1 Tax=Pedobacter albus TaxID=3113905 RepID=A0ABU7I464_9SPHI|nr:hypothetical protein [Pedobacter sp. KR3-3]MEE1944049.1 hypothetical protein [Pedobacter sp. KR3-3]